MCGAKSDVRFTPNSDRDSGLPQTVMSALPLKADICGAKADVRFGPEAEINHSQSAVPRRVKRGPHVPLAGPREDGGKCAPCLSYPPPARRSLPRVGGCRHRSSQIRPRRLARVQANAAADCANPPHTYPWVRGRCCTTKLRGCLRGAVEDCL